MKKGHIINMTISGLIATALIPSVRAQTSEPVAPRSYFIAGHPVQSFKWMNQQGTTALQEKVLMQINQGLFSGWLSAKDASRSKSRLNQLNDQESWYNTLNNEIPADLLAQHTAILQEMMQTLHPKIVPLAAVDTALHGDIDELIERALAQHKISSGEAETYYLRLAQIDSTLESIKRGPDDLREQSGAVDEKLRNIKTELVGKFN